MDVLLEQKEKVENAQSTPALRLTDIADEALVELIQQGSEAAFAELTRRYMHRSYSIAYRMVGDMEAARDLSQDVFVKIYSSIHTFKKDSKFFSWFYRILINHCINYTRRRKALIFIPFSNIYMQSGKTPETEDSENENGENVLELQRIVRAAVNRLSSQHRQVIVLCDLEGFQQEEAAEILRIPVGTVKSRLHYARQELKRLLNVFITEL